MALTTPNTQLAVLGLHKPGLWEWATTTQSLTASIAILGPAAVGAVALEAGLRMRHSHRLELRQSVIGVLRPVLSHYLASLIWPLLGFAAGIVVTGAIMVLQNGYGTPVWLWLLATAAGLIFASTCGFAVGIFATFRWFVPPIAALVAYFLFIPFSQFLPNEARWVSHLYFITGDATELFSGYRWSTLAGEAIWYVAISAVVFLVCVARIGTRVSRLFVVALPATAAVAVVGILLVASGKGVITEGYVRPVYACADGRPQVCVAEPYKAAIPALERQFEQFNRKTVGTYLEATKLQQSYAGSAQDLDGSRAIYLQDVGVSAAPIALQMYVQYTLAPNCQGTAEFQNLAEIVYSWLVAQPDPYAALEGKGPVGAASARFERMTESGKVAWLKAHAQDIRTCSLTSAAF